MLYIYMRKNAQAFNMLQTVRINYEGYMKKEIESAILARKVQARVGHPSDAELKKMVLEKLLENFPVKLEQITNANDTPVPNVAGIRGKYVRTNPTQRERK